MAVNSIADFSSFLNHQRQTQEILESCLWKLEALMTVALHSSNFYELSKHIRHDYFSVMGELIMEAIQANQTSLNGLLRHSG